MVVSALVPYLALSAAMGPLEPAIRRQLHMSAQTMSLASGLANAGYAVGTVVAVQFAQHLPQRRMMVSYGVLLVLGSIITAAAQNPAMFIVGHILQGFSTSLLLIAAVPPLALGFGAAKLRETAVIMSMCIFGAVTAGPVMGGIQAAAGGWRPLFWIIAGVSVLSLVLAVLTFEDQPAADRTAPWDAGATGLAAVGSVAAFYGASQLLTHPFLSAWTIGPLLGGIAVIFYLVIHEYHIRRPLLIVRPMLGSTIPVAGVTIALFAAAASVSSTSLTATLQVHLYSPLHLGLLYLPELAGAILTAVALGLLIERKEMQLLPLVGMLFLAAGIGILRIGLPPSQALTLIGSAVTGIGLGATVSPALFSAGFSLPATNLQRVFAIVELFRAVAAFMIAPVFAYLAATMGSSLVDGTGIALWIGFGLALGGAVVAITIYLLGGARPEKPDIHGFMAGRGPAWYSPPLLARVSAGAAAPDAAE
jgi:MFS family permease